MQCSHKMMKKVITFIFLSTFMFYSCVIEHSSASICILNQADYTIYVYNAYDKDSLSMNGGLDLFWHYDNFYGNKDTLIHPSYRAEPESVACVNFRKKRKDIFGSLKDRNLRLFIIKEETMLKYTWEEICKYQMYETKLILTENELKENNWTVVYE